jgi:hypothetical protein
MNREQWFGEPPLQEQSGNRQSYYRPTPNQQEPQSRLSSLMGSRQQGGYEAPDTSLFVPLGRNQIAPQLNQRLSDLLDKQDAWKPYIPQSQRKSRFEYEGQ